MPIDYSKWKDIGDDTDSDDNKPGIRAGQEVQAYGLANAQELNGLCGVVKKRDASGRIGIDFGPPHGVKALKPKNVRSVSPTTFARGNEKGRVKEEDMQRRIAAGKKKDEEERNAMYEKEFKRLNLMRQEEEKEEEKAFYKKHRGLHHDDSDEEDLGEMYHHQKWKPSAEAAKAVPPPPPLKVVPKPEPEVCPFLPAAAAAAAAGGGGAESDLKELERLKKVAIEEEDFDEAKRLKERIAQLKGGEKGAKGYKGGKGQSHKGGKGEKAPTGSECGKQWDAGWADKDLTHWTKERLQELLGDVVEVAAVPVKGGEACIIVRVTKVEVDGTANVSTSRGRRRHIYDVAITVTWVAQIPSEAGDEDWEESAIQGTLKLPEVDHTEEPPYRVEYSPAIYREPTGPEDDGKAPDSQVSAVKACVYPNNSADKGLCGKVHVKVAEWLAEYHAR